MERMAAALKRAFKMLIKEEAYEFFLEYMFDASATYASDSDISKFLNSFYRSIMT